MNDDDPAAAHLHFSYTKDAGIILGFVMMVARKSFTFSSSFHFSLQADWNGLGAIHKRRLLKGGREGSKMLEFT